MLVIVNTVHEKELDDLSADIQTDVEILTWYVVPTSTRLFFVYFNVTHSNLAKITRDLNEIKDQNRWLTFFFKNLNKAKLDECIVRLQVALEQFQVS